MYFIQQKRTQANKKKTPFACVLLDFITAFIFVKSVSLKQ
nr:MAG TPA: hypothetical protein [Caudoviricetes sp.]